ncbi:hypothetical protein AVEN_21288-1, partial [Araneus ventricosus]
CDCDEDDSCYFDGKGKICKCLVGFSERAGKWEICDCGVRGWCYFVFGQKQCKCEEGYAEKNGRCEVCSCGRNTVCQFIHGAKACACLPGYIFNDIKGECDECDCGSYGSCTFSNGKKTCACDEDFKENLGRCKECNCGKFGSCYFKNNSKTCECEEHSAEYQGICTKCDCGPHGECGFSDKGDKICKCLEGFAERISSETCNKTCNHNGDCANGGSCVQEENGKFCICQPGVMGDRCETIEDCVGGKFRKCVGEFGTCKYNVTTKRAECTCAEGKKIHPAENICKAPKHPERAQWLDDKVWGFGTEDREATASKYHFT